MPPLLMAAASATVLCSSLATGDERAYCQAVERQDSGACYAIMDADLRTACRAEVLAQPEVCLSIPDPARRSACRARAQHVQNQTADERQE